MLGGSVKLEILQFKVEFVAQEVLNSLSIYFVEFRDDTGGNESMFQSKPDFFAIREDELVEVVEYELQGFRIGLVELDYLADAAGIEGFVFDIAEVAKYLLNFLLHLLSS